MSWFLSLSSLIGLVIAVLGFYLSVRLDLPLGPTDVAFGCVLIFIVYAVQLIVRKSRGSVGILVLLVFLGFGCSAHVAPPSLNLQAFSGNTLWLAPVRNSTGTDLRLPGSNPLRSLGEIAGKITADYRPTVMDLLRGSLQREFENRKITVSLPEEHDSRLQSFPVDANSAAINARSTNLSGWLLLIDIRRWHTDGRSPLRTWVDVRLVRIEDGAVSWDKQIQKTTPLIGAGRLDEVSADAAKEILRDVFGS